MRLEYLKKIMIGLAILVLLSEVIFVIYHFETTQKKVTTSRETQTQNQMKVTSPTKPNASGAQVPVTKYYYPISNYASRLTFRYYGLYVTPAQQASPCGAPFTGYHDGDDLETTAAEQNIDVQVYAIAAATVRQVGYVSGYGGLMVLGTNIDGQDYTIYYGHINLASVTVGTGGSVTTGEKLADLGAACSTETDGERKHLHFAIHKGTGIDVRGYVPDQATLANWVNPSEFLKNLGAK
jgi:murein DD-endopeptidase MepM/ murein hydrolase activator NlpD